MTNDGIRNVFILTADSLGYKYFSDHVASIANQVSGINFCNAIAPATNTRCSAPAFHAGIFSDSELLEFPPIKIPESGSVPTVAELFKEDGYETGFWTPNHIFGAANNYDRGFNHGNKGRTQGNKQVADLLRRYGTKQLFNLAQRIYFQAVKPITGVVRNNEGYVWSAASEVQDDMLSWLDQNENEPVFCWIHYMDTHHPFEPPTEYLENIGLYHDWERKNLSYITRDAIKTNGDGLTEEEISDVKRAYRAACQYLVDQVQMFIELLSNKGYYDPNRDLLCFTADHGEAFNPKKHGIMGHATFFEEIIRVPLVLSHPNWGNETLDNQVSLIDIMPTVLNAADVRPPDTYEGTSYSEPRELAKEYVYSIDGNPIRRCIRGSGQKLFSHRLSEGSYEVVFTEYTEGSAVEEKIIFKRELKKWKASDPQDLPEDCAQLYRRVCKDHGGVIEGNPKYLSQE